MWVAVGTSAGYYIVADMPVGTFVDFDTVASCKTPGY